MLLLKISEAYQEMFQTGAVILAIAIVIFCVVKFMQWESHRATSHYTKKNLKK